ncbi:GntR family transcriptional regulator [Pseudovibrio sp. SPO723]|uniref:GntR family transcriptional regulator n=1 Tax=Nesiotobacter zosterae TaxID=392721 RepID=UPI0029C41C12|nr:GntR family transcriptional regulator [Pseudovibrio sp. SPO723]MDX5594286.1 GntR family transcriptional regulator [Pseudovibrio sp. SPO723]
MQQGRQTWKAVRERIHDWILSGRYGPGDKLPKDSELALQMDCARSTIQRAMQDLSDSGIIERRRKGGTHVRKNPLVRATLDIPVTRHEIEGRGGQYGYQLIEKVQRPPTRAVQAALGMAEPQDMLQIVCLHLSDGRPYTLENRWVSIETVPDILQVDLTRENANEWLLKNAPYTRFELKFYALNADEKTAELLSVQPGSALLAIERATWVDEAAITTVTAITAPGYQLLSRS